MKLGLLPNLRVKTKQHPYSLGKQQRRQNFIASWLKRPRFWLAIALVACFISCTLGPCRLIFNQEFWVDRLQHWGPWSACIFICIYTLLTVIGIPGTVLTVAGGIAFGLAWGTFWSVLGATLGAVGAFLLARYLLHDWAERRFRRHQSLNRFTQAVQQMPLQFVLAVRFAPISPFNIVNFLFGLTPIDLKTYAVGTFVGIIPGTLAYTWLGVAGKDALMGGDRVPLFLALGFLTLLSVLPILAKKKQ